MASARARRWHRSAIVGLSALSVLVTACSSTTSTAEPAPSTTAATEATTDETTPDESTTTTSEPETSAMTEDSEVIESPPSCERLTDFATDGEHGAWFIVNDDVMGGRSDGEISFGATAMRFEGSINTDGGGFASVRADLEPGTLEGASHLIVRVRSDGRPYQFTFSDRLEGRDPRVSHRSTIDAVASDEWQEVRVELTSLQASRFGRLVDTPPLDLPTVWRMGIILADGVDGSFALEIDWIDRCPS